MFCQNCGEEIVPGGSFCQKCGAPVAQLPAQAHQYQQPALQCPVCGSGNVSVQLVQIGGKTKKKGVGLGGHANNAARGLTAACTLGMSNLVWKKSKGEEKTRFQNQKVCLCQNCGNSWEI